MKKFIAAVLTVSFLFGLCACKDKKNNYFFENQTGKAIDGLYISTPDSMSWGDKLNKDIIRSGGSLDISTDNLTSEDGIYDLGAIDEDGLNYDIFEVKIHAGDTLVLTRNEEEAVLTVTSADGDKEEYKGEAYLDDAEDEEVEEFDVDDVEDGEDIGEDDEDDEDMEELPDVSYVYDDDEEDAGGEEEEE